MGRHAEDGKPVYGHVLDNESDRVIEGIKGVYRADTGMPLGVVGEDYNVFQNHQMISLFEKLANGHKITYEVAGGLGAGETVWVLAKIEDLKLDIGGDEMNSYMLISNGHIGNRTLTVSPTLIRVVCQNTLRMSDQKFRENRAKNKKAGKKQDVHSGYAIRHTSGMDAAIKEVEKAYNSILTDVTLTKEMFEAMTKVSVTTEMKDSFFNFIVDPKKDESAAAKELSKRGETMRANKIDSLNKLFESSTNRTAASNGTVWGLYNSVVEFADFDRGTRCTDGKEESACKFEAAMFGSGIILKDLAFTKALELVG
jgi:phage/plasmid-like protein (TIGR03299 family)